jgi:ATP-dependent DNA helicase PIF1
MSISLLSPRQKEAVYAIEDGDNIFITGSAGTGKSFLLQYLKRNYLSSGLHVTASTGIAAINVGGQTIHSWSGIGLGNLPVEQLIKNFSSPKFSRLKRRIKMANMLAIDEVSMISAKTFDLLNELFKDVRKSKKAFGGLQLILFGDFLQLPPIDRDYNSLPNYNFCFQSEAWSELNLRNFVLSDAFRQKDNNFVSLLNNIRYGKIDAEAISILESRFNVVDAQKDVKPTTLVTHNAQMESINKSALQAIPSPSKFFEATFSGDKYKIENLRKNCLASEKLELKNGSQVMMLKNTYQKEGVINGSLGVIKGFSLKRGYPIVEFKNGSTLTISPEDWALEKYDQATEEVVTEAKMTQIPLLLSWAITIHKSQGMTLDKIKCDLSRSFSDGQIYVALSRVKTLEGLFIDGLDFNKISANKDVVEFYKNLEKSEQDFSNSPLKQTSLL